MPLPTTAPSEALRSLNTFSLHVTVHIKPEDLDSFYEAMKPVFEAVCNEPELLYFEMFQDPDEPGKLSWVENWNASVEWLMKVQLQKDYYKPYLEATEPMFTKEREFKILKKVPGYVCGKKENFREAFVGQFRS